MSVIDTLITDRTASDAARVRSLAGKIKAGTATISELAEWNSLAMKGGYNYTDLNRVAEAINYVDGLLKKYGYQSGVSWKTESGSSLPDGYTELEYIQSSGTQYINTGFNPNQNTRVVAGIEADSLDCIFGTANGYGVAMYSFIGIGSNSFRSDFGNTLNSVSLSDSVLSAKFEVNKNKNVTSVNGSELLTSTSNTFQCSYPLIIGGFNNAGSIIAIASIKLYSFQIYDNGTLIRDYVPAKNSGGTVGLYDLAGKQFYTNAGTGTFTAGPENTGADVPTVWAETDHLTPPQAAFYLSNMDKLRDTLTVYSTTPEVPGDMDGLTVGEANDIEKILEDLDAVILTMTKTFISCGDGLCGGDYL